jgi:hypothetical protein
MVHLRAGLLLVLATGCIPNLSVDDALVTQPEVVAIQSEPPEAAEGASVKWTALYVTAQGSVSDAPISWDLCTTRQALADSGPLNTACFGTDPSEVVALGSGLSVSGAISADACRLYGPDAPAAVNGQPAGRPVDPDPTGGYYQPLVAHTSVSTAGATRISCGIAGATQEQAAQFVQTYHANTNPAVASLQLGPKGSEAMVPASGLVVKAGSQNNVIASWAACASAPCTGAEPYVVFDVTSQQILQHQESMRVSWYTTGGTFANARGGVTEAEAATTTRVENSWVAPTTAGDVTMWVVLVDDRGGTGWESYVLHVQ